MGQLNVRYPPFESRRLNPSHLPMVEAATSSNVGGDLKIESSDGWLIERSVGRAHCGGDVDEEAWPRVVTTQREGWYLQPHPLHRGIRRAIDGIALLMLLTLLYLFIAPGLELVGITPWGTNSVRLGLLDYPLLGLVVVPVILLPLVLRIGVNVTELRRQRALMDDEDLSIMVEIDVRSSADHATVQLNGPSAQHATDASLAVGALPPQRRRVLELLERRPTGQPPPGSTTEILGINAPSDDGTGFGEDAPMQHHGWPGGLYLRPMRLGEEGPWEAIDRRGIARLQPPEGPWPGSLYDDIVLIHWEVVVRFQHPKHGVLMHVTPLKMPWSEEHAKHIMVEARDGRVELWSHEPIR